VVETTGNASKRAISSLGWDNADPKRKFNIVHRACLDYNIAKPGLERVGNPSFVVMEITWE
jgi:hypothetical protein